MYQGSRRLFLVFSVLVAGCAEPPISRDLIQDADLQACSTLAAEHSIAKRAALRGVVESARATGVATGIVKLAEALGGAVSTSTVLPGIVAGYAVTSAMNGAIEAQDRRDAIVRECLRDLGHKVY
jgi:hypothetical protein